MKYNIVTTFGTQRPILNYLILNKIILQTFLPLIQTQQIDTIEENLKHN